MIKQFIKEFIEDKQDLLLNIVTILAFISFSGLMFIFSVGTYCESSNMLTTIKDKVNDNTDSIMSFVDNMGINDCYEYTLKCGDNVLVDISYSDDNKISVLAHVDESKTSDKSDINISYDIIDNELVLKEYHNGNLILSIIALSLSILFIVFLLFFVRHSNEI